jgi:hypothetical protein
MSTTMDAAHRRWWHKLVGVWPDGRTAGDPPSGNGASSFHLRWDLQNERREDALSEVAVTLEVLEPPTVDRLYFWALQADFGDGRGRAAGGGHLGLQWHPQYPGSTAVNWGGYDAAGRILDGTASALPSALGNPHTRDYRWRPGAPYRLAIARVDGPDGSIGWRGSVTDADGVTTAVRDLLPSGDRITGVVMWSEVFARCDHPSTAVRWSRPVGMTADGRTVAPTRVSVNYQRHGDGGCVNTDSSTDGTGVVQRTSVDRTTVQGAWLPVPG